MRRRWIMRSRDLAGHERHLVLHVPADGDGAIHVTVEGLTLVFSPAEVAKLRRLIQEAQAVALWDRGHW